MATAPTALWSAWRTTRDDAAFEQLVRPELPALLDAARRAGLGPHDAEEVVQESLAELAREGSGRPARVGVGAWLMRSVSLKATVKRRAARRRQHHETRVIETSRACDPGTFEVRERVEHALEQLEASDRQALVFRYLYDLDYREMAYVLGISPNACRVRVHRASGRLRARLGRSAPALLAVIPLEMPPRAAATVAAATSGIATTGGWGALLLGGLLMGTGTKIVGATLGVAAVAAGLFLSASSDGTRPSPASDEAAREAPSLMGAGRDAATVTPDGPAAAADQAGTTKPTVVDLSDPNQAWLFLQVVDEAGNAVIGATASLLDDKNERVGGGTTLHEGKTWFWPRNGVRLVVWKRGHYAPQVRDVAFAGKEEHVRVELVAGLSITGTLLAPDGRPLQRSVYASPIDGQPWHPEPLRTWRGRADSAGRFEIKGLLPGRYRIHPRVFAKKGEYVGQAPKPAVQAEAGARDVEVRMHATGRFTVLVFDAVSREPIDENRDLYRVTDTGDSWEQQIAKGPVHRERPPGEVETLRVYAEGYAPSEPLTLDYGAPRTERVLEVYLQPRPESVGTVTFSFADDRGDPVSRVNWTRWYERIVRTRERESTVSYGVGTTHEDFRGELTVTLPAGSHRLAFQIRGDERGFDPRFVRQETRVTVGGGESRHVEIRFARAGSIEIKLPAKWQRKGLVLRDSKGNNVRHKGIENLEPDVRLFTRIEPGRYVLTLQLDGANQARELEVRPGERTIIDFADEPK